MRTGCKHAGHRYANSAVFFSCQCKSEVWKTNTECQQLEYEYFVTKFKVCYFVHLTSIYKTWARLDNTVKLNDDVYSLAALRNRKKENPK